MGKETPASDKGHLCGDHDQPSQSRSRISRPSVEFAKWHHLVSMIDNTFASPINFRPPEWGFDLSLHSCTKYLNGHSDIVAGAVIGRADLVQKTVHKLNHLGGSLDPHACFLLHRGMKTLGVRVNPKPSALQIARFLESHSSILRVNYTRPSQPPRPRESSVFVRGIQRHASFEVKGGLEASTVYEEDDPSGYRPQPWGHRNLAHAASDHFPCRALSSSARRWGFPTGSSACLWGLNLRKILLLTSSRH